MKMPPKNQMARELEELREELAKEKRERRELEASRVREERQMRRERLKLIARIESLEKERQEPRGEEVRGRNHGENHEEEEVGNARQEHETTDDPEERRFMRIIKVVQGNGGKNHIDFPIYQGKMDSEEVLGWIEALENYFDLEDIEADKKVKVAKARLRGTTLTWWTSVQNEREERWCRAPNLCGRGEQVSMLLNTLPLHESEDSSRLGSWNKGLVHILQVGLCFLINAHVRPTSILVWL